MNLEQLKPLIYSTVKQYIAHNKIEVKNPNELNERFKSKGIEYLNRILETVKKDGEAASLGLPTKNLTALQREAGRISLTHGLTKLAEYLVTGRETLEEIN